MALPSLQCFFLLHSLLSFSASGSNCIPTFPLMNYESTLIFASHLLHTLTDMIQQVRANLAKTKLNFAYCRNSAFEMNVQNRNEKSKSTWKWKLMLDFKLTCLAYSTFLKQVRQLQLQLISLFDVCFPILLFGIFKFSFLVHIWECRRWPREAPHVNSLFYMLEASKITSNESDLFIWCLFSDSTLWNSQIILNCTYFRFGSAWGDQRGASHE